MATDLLGVVSCIGLLLMAIVSLPQTLRLWRNEPTRIDNYRLATPIGTAIFKAFRRSLPGALGFGIPVLSSALVLIVAGGASTPTGEVARGVFVVLCCLTICLITPVYFVNRPRWLVPPHLRTEPGLLAELL